MKKTMLAIALSLVCLSLSLSLFASCGSCGSSFSPPPCGDCGSCQVSVNCCPYDTPCQCTDPNAGTNPCLSRCEYCEAFGNVGILDDLNNN